MPALYYTPTSPPTLTPQPQSENSLLQMSSAWENPSGVLFQRKITKLFKVSLISIRI
jgi:hypothetical protein